MIRQRKLKVVLGPSMRVSKKGLEASPTLADVREAGQRFGGRTALDTLVDIRVEQARLEAEIVATNAQIVVTRARARDDFHRVVELQQRRTGMLEHRAYR